MVRPLVGDAHTNPTVAPIGESPMAILFFLIKNAVCPGGEGAVLKTVGCNRLAGSNPVHGAIH